MFKRFLCLFLALMLPCAALADYVMAGFDPENTYRDWNTNLFMQRMQEKTGVEFTYQQYRDAAQWKQAKAAMTANGNLPDVLFKAELTDAECIDMLEKGVLIDLAPYLDAYCPNLTALLNANPEYRNAITLPDGRIAALPYISEQPLQNVLWMNKEWMDTLNLQLPTTAEELTEVLRAFRERDPNRNARQDEIALAYIGSFDLKFLAHAYGLTANDFNVFARDGKAYFMPLEDAFRPFVEWLHALYAEQLIDPDGFNTSDQLRRVEKADAVNVYGSVLTTMVSNFLPTEWMTKYVAVPPLQYNGTQVYRSFAGNVFKGTFAVTSACDNVEEVLRWVDLFYTEEISILSSAGLANVDYLVDGDGTWRITEAASDNMYFTGETLIVSGGTVPGTSSDAFQRRFHEPAVRFVSDQAELVTAISTRPFPYYALSYEQEAVIGPLQAKIGRYVDESLMRWVTGEEPITDESFATFEKTLNEMGLKEFMAFWQDVLDTQKK